MFGEYLEILSKKDKNWFRVRCTWDDVIGWMDPKQLYILKEKDASALKPCTTYTMEHLYGISSESETIPIPIGSSLPGFDGINISLPFGRYTYNGGIVDTKKITDSAALLINIAKRLIHSPFMKGGRSVLGIDNSGYVQLVYKMTGIDLPRTCAEQAKLGEDIGFMLEAKQGDLAFFEDTSSQIIHVGLVMNSDQIIHVHGRVRIDRLDQQGIYDKKKRRYIYKLRTIRSIISGK